MNKTQFIGTVVVANLMATYMLSLPLKAENIRGNSREYKIRSTFERIITNKYRL